MERKHSKKIEKKVNFNEKLVKFLKNISFANNKFHRVANILKPHTNSPNNWKADHRKDEHNFKQCVIVKSMSNLVLQQISNK